MTLDASTLDAVDRAFLWHADQARRRLPEPLKPPPSRVEPSRQVEPPRQEEPSSQEAAIALAPAAVASVVDRAAVPTPVPEPSPEPIPEPILAAEAVAGTLADRLLQAVPDAWAHLAQQVENAYRDGAEVIAITGARRGEGRTTVVECLARTLVARGSRVECHDRGPQTPAIPTRDGRPGSCIVLVDAGVWFPGGPLRRAWLERQSLGCDAAILVRRDDQPECDARGAALEAIGLKVLGEVLTMVPADSLEEKKSSADWF